MKELIYLTTNPNKVNEANEFFGKKYGFNIKIVNPDFEILEIEVDKNHVHLLVESKPKVSPLMIVRTLKQQITIKLWNEFSDELCKYF